MATNTRRTCIAPRSIRFPFSRAILLLGIASLGSLWLASSYPETRRHQDAKAAGHGPAVAAPFQANRFPSLSASLIGISLFVGLCLAGGAAIHLCRKTKKIETAHEARFQNLLRQWTDIAMHFDRKLRCLYANPALQAISNRETPDALEQIGQGPVRVPAAVKRRLEPMLHEVISSGMEKDLQVEWTASNGSDYCVHFFLSPEFGPDGKLLGLLAIGRDILPLRKAERQLEESRAMLRQFLVHREEAREDERRRIAKDLHEELGQVLTALRLQLAILRTAPSQAENKTQTMIEMVDNAIRGMRTVVNVLRPATLDIGIVAALDWLATQFSAHTGIACTTKFDDEKRIVLSDSQATKVFRIAQEALANVARHAKANQVSLWLLRDQDQLVLQVRDDGCGFDSAAIITDAFGLLGIRERAAMLDGSVDIVSAPSRGTHVTVRFPADDAG